MFVASSITSSLWILDSGATHHMTSDATKLVDLSLTPSSSQVCTTDNTLLSVVQHGRLIPTSTAHSSIALPDVHHLALLYRVSIIA